MIGVPDEASALPHLAEADVWIGFCSEDVLRAGTKLRWIQLPSAGAESCQGQPLLRERGIIVSNMRALHGAPIAETAIGMMMSFARGLHVYRVQQEAGQWDHALDDVAAIFGAGMFEVRGKVALVVGLGGTGTEIARRANGLGMRVIATRNSRREGPDFVEYVGLAPEARDLAARADVVFNAVPLTPATRGMFDAAFFGAMKPTAYFINVGRGATVVTDDLETALRGGVIAGAGLDVTDPEPLPPDHAFWRMPNVLLMPHVSWTSDDRPARGAREGPAAPMSWSTGDPGGEGHVRRMAADELPQNFDRFFRGSGAAAAAAGAGLGLPIARWIADAHGADIEVDGTPGRGTTVTAGFQHAGSAP